MSISGKGVEKLHSCIFNSTGLQDIAISPPEKMIRSVRITKACLEPSGVVSGISDTPIRRAVGLQGSRLHLYDIQTESIIGSESV